MSFDCQSCGACCAFSYDWPEFSEEDNCEGIPLEMCDCDHGRMRCIGDRCVALSGQIGVKVSCAVYAARPVVCKQFEPGTEECKRVRLWTSLPLAEPSSGQAAEIQRAKETKK